MNKANGTGSIERSARVRRIKRVIIGLIVAAILLPTVLCVFLLFKINKLEETVAELSLSKETISIVTDNTLVRVPNVSNPEKASDKLTHFVSEADNALMEKTRREALDKEESESVILPDEALKADTGGIAVDNAYTDKEYAFDESLLDNSSKNEGNEEAAVKKVYLTFDDGPSSNTHRILDILNDYNVKATFFVVGRLSDTTTPLYKRIVDEGHTIGMHSYSHKYNEIYKSEDDFIYDVNQIQDLIFEQTGVLPHFYRFPGGSSNTVSHVSIDRLKSILSNRGIIYYDWNVSSGDATATYGLSVDEIVSNVINGSKGKDEVMILMHDLPEKFTTTEALPRIIEYFQEQGAEILPIDETSSQFVHES